MNPSHMKELLMIMEFSMDILIFLPGTGKKDFKWV